MVSRPIAMDTGRNPTSRDPFSTSVATYSLTSARASKQLFRSVADLVRAMLSPPMLSHEQAGYFYAVDLLRGLAAVAILFWHYSHFFTVGERWLPHATSDDPLYSVFWLMYDHGGNAVQLFWLISGFTFSAVYTARRVITRTFVVHRFARLYPLHLLTLLCVAVLQLVSMNIAGHTQIYGHNDRFDFINQLFLASGWGALIRFSFNGPVWTVSVELLVYALFWVLLPRLFAVGAVLPFVLATLALELSRLGPYAHILQGCFFFFAGCGLFSVYVACRKRTWTKMVSVGLPMAGALTLFLHWHAVGPGSALFFASVVLAAAFVRVEHRSLPSARAMKWLGDNTYGIYLWHVPVQIAILLVVGQAGLGTQIYHSPVFLLSYLAGVIMLARLSFLGFERPCRTLLNRIGSGTIDHERSVG